MKIKTTLLLMSFVITAMAFIGCSVDETHSNQIEDPTTGIILPPITEQNTEYGIDLLEIIVDAKIANMALVFPRRMGSEILAVGVISEEKEQPKAVNFSVNELSTSLIGTSRGIILIKDLNPSSTYSIRPYVITHRKTVLYGLPIKINTLEVTQIPETVIIGNQTWTSRNFEGETYSDGTEIPQVTNLQQLNDLKTGAWCYYDNDEANGRIYGKLYNRYAIEGIHDEESLIDVTKRKKLAPAGWHVSNLEDWSSLIRITNPNFLIGYSSKIIPKVGGLLKSQATYWNSPNVSATDAYGFNALPGGMLFNYRYENLNNKANFHVYDPRRVISTAFQLPYDIFTISSENGSLYLSKAIYLNDFVSVRLVKD